jgi:valyl-tRNA synthetase
VPEPAIRAMIEQNCGAIKRLGNVEKITFVESSLAKQAGSRSTARFDVHVIYERKIDVTAERERLRKELEKLEKEFANNQRQLSNEQFLAKAPPKVVEGLRARVSELTSLIDKIKKQLEGLNSAGPDSGN